MSYHVESWASWDYATTRGPPDIPLLSPSFSPSICRSPCDNTSCFCPIFSLWYLSPAPAAVCIWCTLQINLPFRHVLLTPLYMPGTTSALLAHFLTRLFKFRLNWRVALAWKNSPLLLEQYRTPGTWFENCWNQGLVGEPWEMGECQVVIIHALSCLAVLFF